MHLALFFLCKRLFLGEASGGARFYCAGSVVIVCHRGSWWACMIPLGSGVAIGSWAVSYVVEVGGGRLLFVGDVSLVLDWGLGSVVPCPPPVVAGGVFFCDIIPVLSIYRGFLA